MPRHNPVPASTDRQRLLRTPVPQVPKSSDRQRLLKLPVSPPLRKPVAAGPSTFLILGKDGTFLSLDFGFGRLARQIRLADYLPAGLVPQLSNLTFDLTGVLPDAFGLDIGLAGGLELNNALAIFQNSGGWAVLGSVG
jgi:hypothetical protein